MEYKEKYRTHELCQYDYSDIWEKSFDENYTDTPLRNDEIVKLLNDKDKKINELTSQLNRFEPVVFNHNGERALILYELKEK